MKVLTWKVGRWGWAKWHAARFPYLRTACGIAVPTKGRKIEKQQAVFAAPGEACSRCFAGHVVAYSGGAAS